MSLSWLMSDAARFTQKATEAHARGDFTAMGYWVRRQTRAVARVEEAVAAQRRETPSAPEPAVKLHEGSASQPLMVGSSVSVAARAAKATSPHEGRPAPPAPALTGNDLRKFRESEGHTFRGLGAKLGVNPGTLAKLESRAGKALPEHLAAQLGRVMEEN